MKAIDIIRGKRKSSIKDSRALPSGRSSAQSLERDPLQMIRSAETKREARRHSWPSFSAAIFSQNLEEMQELTKGVSNLNISDEAANTSQISSIEASEENLRGPAHWGGTGHGNRLGIVPMLPLASAPADIWHNVKQLSHWSWLRKHHYVFGSNRAITGGHVREPLEFFARRSSMTKRPINILTGSHGTRNGDNWIPIPHGPVNNNGVRNPRVIEPQFLNEDRIAYGGNLSGTSLSSLRGRIRIVDIDGMTGDEFERYMTNKKEHVILAYCYGRNDEGLRYFRGLPPVTSYV